MNNLLTKISTWFKPKPTLPPSKPKTPIPQLAQPQPINHQRYWQLINQLEKEMSQNESQRRSAC